MVCSRRGIACSFQLSHSRLPRATCFQNMPLWRKWQVVRKWEKPEANLSQNTYAQSIPGAVKSSSSAQKQRRISANVAKFGTTSERNIGSFKTSSQVEALSWPWCSNPYFSWFHSWRMSVSEMPLVMKMACQRHNIIAKHMEALSVQTPKTLSCLERKSCN